MKLLHGPAEKDGCDEARACKRPTWKRLALRGEDTRMWSLIRLVHTEALPKLGIQVAHWEADFLCEERQLACQACSGNALQNFRERRANKQPIYLLRGEALRLSSLIRLFTTELHQNRTNKQPPRSRQQNRPHLRYTVRVPKPSDSSVTSRVRSAQLRVAAATAVTSYNVSSFTRVAAWRSDLVFLGRAKALSVRSP